MQKSILSNADICQPSPSAISGCSSFWNYPRESVPTEAWELVELTDFAVQLRYESFEYDDEPLDRPGVIRQVAALVEGVDELVSEAYRLNPPTGLQ
jgi:hypothetical protein